MKANYDITGMSCAACSSTVERVVKALDITEVSVNLLSGVMKVDFDENTVSDADIRNAVIDAGFGIDTAKTSAEKRKILQENAEKNQKSLLFRLIISVIIMFILMYFSMGHMINLPLPSVFEKPLVLACTQLLLTLPILIINKAYFTNGIKHLISRTPNMDSLIAAGSSSALIYGVFAIIQIALGDTHYVHDLYFETAAMIPTLVTVGKYLEGKSKAGTGRAIEMLIDLTPKKATVISNGIEKEIEVSLLKENDTVIVKPGQSFPCDGYVINGESYADESSLTGESMPVFKKSGDKVNAGTINTNGTLTVKAEKVGDDTVISGIVRLVEESSGSKAPISRLADRISLYFVPAVFAISLVTFIIWMLVGQSFEFSFSRAMCVLVISCPCSLGLATPVAIMAGTGVAATNGILIKSAEILEVLGKTDVILFDKTGTLTHGSPIVTDIIPFTNTDKNAFLKLCAGLESMSEHPLAYAITDCAKQKGIKYESPTFFEAIPGKGLTAKLGENTYNAGNPKLFEELSIVINESEKKVYDELCLEGKTPLLFAENGKYIGLIAVSDSPKSDSMSAIRQLKKVGIECVMLTGDNEVTADAIAKQIGIDSVFASVSPSDKEKYVRQYQNLGKKVAMCGDGINDSPALARANVGITVSKGTDIALETSDVILMHNDVTSVPKAIALSKATVSNIKLSLFWALLYNTLGIPIAAGILFPVCGLVLNPMIGAAAMSLSSVCVVTNALRLKKFKYE